MLSTSKLLLAQVRRSRKATSIDSVFVKELFESLDRESLDVGLFADFLDPLSAHELAVDVALLIPAACECDAGVAADVFDFHRLRVGCGSTLPQPAADHRQTVQGSA